MQVVKVHTMRPWVLGLVSCCLGLVVCFSVFYWTNDQANDRAINHSFSKSILAPLPSTHNSTYKKRKVSVFYHVFTGEGALSDAASIVLEQVSELQQHGRVLESPPHIYYVVVGQYMNVECPPHWGCTLLKHVQQGWEEETLGQLYDYCTRHPEEYVVYMHNKGSFHPSKENTAIRRLLTKAVLSEGCLGMDTDTCNICSARFSPAPHFHSPGNMWLAHCSYIQRLLPPEGFAAAVGAVVDQQMLQGWEKPPGWQVGTERFGSEHWAFR